MSACARCADRDGSATPERFFVALAIVTFRYPSACTAYRATFRWCVALCPRAVGCAVRTVRQVRGRRTIGPRAHSAPYALDGRLYSCCFARSVMGCAADSVVASLKTRTLSLIHISEPTRRTPISYAV